MLGFASKSSSGYVRGQEVGELGEGTDDTRLGITAEVGWRVYWSSVYIILSTFECV